MLIIAPTKELVLQIVAVALSLCPELRTCPIFGGADHVVQAAPLVTVCEPRWTSPTAQLGHLGTFWWRFSLNAPSPPIPAPILIFQVCWFSSPLFQCHPFHPPGEGREARPPAQPWLSLFSLLFMMDLLKSPEFCVSFFCSLKFSFRKSHRHQKEMNLLLLY